jgi:probable HAF family extracellular repeat protein
MQDLTPDLAPLVYSRAVDINDAGQVLIISEDADLGATSSSLIWEDGVLTDLGNLGGDFTNGVDINERGHVVGSFEIPIGRFVFHAFFWDPDGGMQDLGTLGGVTSDALKINELDQVIGNSLNVAGQERAFIWDSANGMQDLGTLGGAFSRASDINESGQIVGISLESGPLHAVIWQPPPPPEPVFCQDMTINELILSDLYNVIDNRDGHLGDKVKGTKGNDLILASDSGNKINAKRGDDCVIGGGGNDKINGGKGDDQIFGQGGSDKINGNKGNDNIQGGDDDDKIHGGHGDDIIKGDGGNDTCHGGHGSNQVDCETVKPMEDEDEDDE